MTMSEAAKPAVSATLTTAADSTEPPSPFAWIAAQGLTASDPALNDFGDPQGESAAALEADVLCVLADRRVIRAHGADAENFLQGQLSNDLRELTPQRAQLSSYSNPKGRVLAVLTLFRQADSIWLETQADIAAETLKRLRLFVLRAKLKLEDAGDEMAAIGLSGADAPAILSAAGVAVPEIVWGCAAADDLMVMRRPDAGGRPRYSVHGAAAALAAVWPALAKKARPVGTAAWRLLDMLAGLPAIHADTREQHVAQMLNLDTLEGISFAKGCYPGQEIVARLHYLGSLKRRMFLGYADAPGLARGTPVFSADGSAMQPVGEVLDRADHPGSGTVLQVVLQLSHREAPLALGSADGPALKLVAA